jgi:hypothetical protein
MCEEATKLLEIYRVPLVGEWDSGGKGGNPQNPITPIGPIEYASKKANPYHQHQLTIPSKYIIKVELIAAYPKEMEADVAVEADEDFHLEFQREVLDKAATVQDIIRVVGETQGEEP